MFSFLALLILFVLKLGESGPVDLASIESFWSTALLVFGSSKLVARWLMSFGVFWPEKEALILKKEFAVELFFVVMKVFSFANFFWFLTGERELEFFLVFFGSFRCFGVEPVDGLHLSVFFGMGIGEGLFWMDLTLNWFIFFFLCFYNQKSLSD